MTSRGKIEEVNANNLLMARIGGLCYRHNFVPTNDAEIHRCSECGIEVYRPAPKQEVDTDE